MTFFVLLYVQEVLPSLYSNLLYKMGQDFFEIQQHFVLSNHSKLAIKWTTVFFAEYVADPFHFRLLDPDPFQLNGSGSNSGVIKTCQKSEKNNILQKFDIFFYLKYIKNRN